MVTGTTASTGDHASSPAAVCLHRMPELRQKSVCPGCRSRARDKAAVLWRSGWLTIALACPVTTSATARRTEASAASALVSSGSAGVAPSPCGRWSHRQGVAREGGDRLFRVPTRQAQCSVREFLRARRRNRGRRAGSRRLAGSFNRPRAKPRLVAMRARHRRVRPVSASGFTSRDIRSSRLCGSSCRVPFRLRLVISGQTLVVDLFFFARIDLGWIRAQRTHLLDALLGAPRAG